MKIICVFALLWSTASGAAIPMSTCKVAPLPVLTENLFMKQVALKVVRSSGKIRAFSNTGIGWIEDQNGNTIRVSAREIKKGKPQKGAQVTFDQKFQNSEWHALNVQALK